MQLLNSKATRVTSMRKWSNHTHSHLQLYMQQLKIILWNLPYSHLPVATTSWCHSTLSMEPILHNTATCIMWDATRWPHPMHVYTARCLYLAATVVSVHPQFTQEPVKILSNASAVTGGTCTATFSCESGCLFKWSKVACVHQKYSLGFLTLK